MLRIGTLGTVAACCVALALGCGKKSDPEPAPGGGPPPPPRPDDPDPKPGNPPLGNPKPRPGLPNPKPGPSFPNYGPPDEYTASANLKKIGLAMHNFEVAHGHFPAGVVGPRGTLGLSWRVAILPYFDNEQYLPLYNQFRLNEPWDSPHNKALIPQMPKEFAPTNRDPSSGMTHLRSFAGLLAFIPDPQPIGPKGFRPRAPWADLAPGTLAAGHRIIAVIDGLSLTLGVAEAVEPVEWTRPADLPFADTGAVGHPAAQFGPVPRLGGQFEGRFHGLLADGSVHFFSNTISENSLRAMITTRAGDQTGPDVPQFAFGSEPPAKAGTPPKSVPDAVPDALPDAAARKQVVANYRTLVKGLHEYHEANKRLPAGIATGPVVGLSWRVQVLPYIGEKALYDQFKLTEPWDSAHNMKLLEKMPKVFAAPGPRVPKGHTFVRTTHGTAGIAWTGGEGLQPPRREPPGTAVDGRPLAMIHDGLSNTIVFAEGREAVPWTKPDELPMSLLPGTPPPPLGGAFPDGFHAVFADGAIGFYQVGYPPAEVAKMLTPASGEAVEVRGHPDRIGYFLKSELTPKK